MVNFCVNIRYSWWLERWRLFVDTSQQHVGIAGSSRNSQDQLPSQGGQVIIDDVRAVVCGALQLQDRVAVMDASTPLMGAIPELDSMVVVAVIAGLEERFGISVADDEISAATFATLGTLTEFVEQKLEG